MKNLFHRHSAVSSKYIYFGSETPGGNETGEYNIEKDAEAQALTQEITLDEIDAMVNGISNSLEKGLNDTNKEEVKAKIQEIVATMGEDEPLYVFLTQTLEGELEQFLQGDLGMKNADLHFNFERTDISTVEKKETEQMLMKVKFDDVNPFPEGKDSLQVALEKEEGVVLDGVNITKRGYVDAEKGVVDAFGEKIKGHEDVSLQELMQKDLSQGRVLDKISSAKMLMDAIQAYNPDTVITSGQVKLLWETLNGSLSSVTNETVGQLQSALSVISSDFEKVINGRDNKYGKGTREGFRTAGAMIDKVVSVHAQEIIKKDFELNFNISVLNGSIVLYKEYQEVLILADHSGSMKNDISSLANVLGVAHQNNQLENTKFAFAGFMKEVNLISELTSDLDDVVSDMKSLHTEGGSERGVDGALKLLKESSVFSDDAERVAKGEKLPKRLIEIVSDDLPQHVTKGELEELQQLAQKRNIDVVFVFSVFDTGKKKPERVPLNIVQSAFRESEKSHDEIKLDLIKSAREEYESALQEFNEAKNKIKNIDQQLKNISDPKIIKELEQQKTDIFVSQLDPRAGANRTAFRALNERWILRDINSHSLDKANRSYKKGKEKSNYFTKLERIESLLKAPQQQASLLKDLERVAAGDPNSPQQKYMNALIAYRDSFYESDPNSPVEGMAYIPKSRETGPLDSEGRQTMLAKQKTGN